ncbi:MAG TPA: hypothetical protein VGP72_00945 [Planctomycetota bacterium]|jgi:hypothetical protein
MKYQETLEIEKDGRGRATLLITLPSRAASESATLKQIEERLAPDPLASGIRRQIHRRQTESATELEIAYSFEDIASFCAWAAQTSSPLNNLSVVRDGRHVEITRRFSGISSGDLPSVATAQFDIPVTFSLRAPYEIDVHNGTLVNGNTVTWEFSARDLLAGSGKTLAARYRVRPSYWLYVFAALLALAAGIVWVRRSRKGRLPTPKMERA